MPIDAGMGQDTRKLLAEMVSHLNEVEEKVAQLTDTIGEVRDLELVNKLDLLNLANELEKGRLTAPSEGGVPSTGALEQVEQAVAGLETELNQLRTQGVVSAGDGLEERVEALSQRLELLEGTVRARAVAVEARESDAMCAKCGSGARAGARFCGKCGSPIGPPHLPYARALADAKSAVGTLPKRRLLKRRGGKR